MTLSEFQEIFEKKSAKEKLTAIVDYAGYYGDDKRNMMDARWRRNWKDYKYWESEAIAMMERIVWLASEIRKVL